METSSFGWPGGARSALSVSFDDARPSQLDHGVRVLDAFGVRATFYVSLEPTRSRAADWAQVARGGHELGNHSKTHPCSANFDWVQNPLEEMTLDDIERELLDANAEIERMLGVRPRTFAYPCGQMFVGRGLDRKSYVPIVARHFEIGRAFLAETDNHPLRCDLAAVASSNLDCMEPPALLSLLERARSRSRWLVLAGHEIGPSPADQTTTLTSLERLLESARSSGDVWIATVAEVGAYLAEQRAAAAKGR